MNNEYINNEYIMNINNEYKSLLYIMDFIMERFSLLQYVWQMLACFIGS